MLSAFSHKALGVRGGVREGGGCLRGRYGRLPSRSVAGTRGMSTGWVPAPHGRRGWRASRRRRRRWCSGAARWRDGPQPSRPIGRYPDGGYASHALRRSRPWQRPGTRLGTSLPAQKRGGTPDRRWRCPATTVVKESSWISYSRRDHPLVRTHPREDGKRRVGLFDGVRDGWWALYARPHQRGLDGSSGRKVGYHSIYRPWQVEWRQIAPSRFPPRDCAGFWAQPLLHISRNIRGVRGLAIAARSSGNSAALVGRGRGYTARAIAARWTPQRRLCIPPCQAGESRCLAWCVTWLLSPRFVLKRLAVKMDKCEVTTQHGLGGILGL